MFTLDTVVDTAVKNTKQVVSYIEHEKIRKDLETLVDAQAQFTKTFYTTAKSMADSIVEGSKTDIAQWDFSKMFAPKKSK
jgi:hypothetical protein